MPPVRRQVTIKGKGKRLVGAEPQPRPLIPDRPPPRTLVLQDLIQGLGYIAERGSKVSIQYVGYDYETGKRFVSSWEKGRPSSFRLGSGTMIEGVEEGLLDMEVGDRREMVIPPDLAYGSHRVGQISPDSHLLFIVDLLATDEPQPPAGGAGS